MHDPRLRYSYIGGKSPFAIYLQWVPPRFPLEAVLGVSIDEMGNFPFRYKHSYNILSDVTFLELGVFSMPQYRFEIECGRLTITLDYAGVWTPAHEYLSPERQTTEPLWWFVEETRVDKLHLGGVKAVSNHHVKREYCASEYKWDHRNDDTISIDSDSVDSGSDFDDEENSTVSSSSDSSLFSSDEESFRYY